MDFRIIDVCESNCHLIVKVEHCKDDEAWCQEHYQFAGREGGQHQIQTNAAGAALMDNGEVAPTTTTASGITQPYLPEGRTYDRYETPFMVDDSILRVIRQCHSARISQPKGMMDELGCSPMGQITQEDRDGCEALLSKFIHLIGYSE
jgi:hypothetical protein